jgi:hypothetical protein
MHSAAQRNAIPEANGRKTVAKSGGERSQRGTYAPAMYTNRTVLRWYARVLRARLKHGATSRGAWREARYIRRIQRGMP